MRMIQFNVPFPKGKSVHVQEDKLTDFYPYFHQHEEYQFMWILRGRGTLFVADSFHTFEQDDIFLLGSNQPHVFKRDVNDTEAVECVSVFFNVNAVFSNLSYMPELSELSTFLACSSNGFKVPEEYKSRVRRRIAVLKKLDTMERLIGFLMLLKELNAVSANLKPLSVGGLREWENGTLRIHDICRYVKENFKRNISLEEVASHANLTPQAFCRYFKKHTGLTFVSYMNELRIQEACELITSERYESIGLVAYNSGFNSITNFNRVFRTVTGFSPKEYYGRYKNNVH
ncbi:helix-turn-helix transcriptional regulator [Sphingobacterium sp. DN00404]|uniref:Helix-turn-helix transcriptional regulator n=1 Tax=Sphingobacterium micropteri TaxID=2763501 RepID=A0ABR7YIX3_9SPHI|nr:AraC family transcriptional regulator [Sphingobacterium micropteri]MBD1431240.1 helix-turn-helix transcriptional regulator [Sphingobacterium micropteri]